MKLTGLRARDIRFPTSRQMDGSDSLNVGDYSATYVTLETDGPLVGCEPEPGQVLEQRRIVLGPATLPVQPDGRAACSTVSKASLPTMPAIFTAVASTEQFLLPSP